MQIKSQQDFWTGAMYLVVGSGFAWGATSYNFGSSARPGAGYFPLGLGLLLALIGGVVLLKSLLINTPGGGRIGRFAWKPLLIIVGSVALFGFALPHLGMVIALPLLVLTSALAGDEFHLGEVLFNAFVLTLASWAIFNRGLGLSIPLWPSFVG